MPNVTLTAEEFNALIAERDALRGELPVVKVERDLLQEKLKAYSKHAGTDLLMMLAIADFADDDGIAYPGRALANVAPLFGWSQSPERGGAVPRGA